MQLQLITAIIAKENTNSFIYYICPICNRKIVKQNLCQQGL